MEEKSLLNRILFQDIGKKRAADPDQNYDPMGYEEISTVEPSNPNSKQWARLSIATNYMQSEREATIFPIQIGRSVPNGINLYDLGVSSHHATICFDGDVLKVKDEFSRNGISVGGEKITPGVATLLMPDVVLKIGRAEIVVIAHSGMGDNTPDKAELAEDMDSEPEQESEPVQETEPNTEPEPESKPGSDAEPVPEQRPASFAIPPKAEKPIAISERLVGCKV